MRKFSSSDFTAIFWANSEVVQHFVNNNGFMSCETLYLYICSGIWGPITHLSLKITNSLAIFILRKPLKTWTRLAGHGIWTRDLPNASLVRYHRATSLGYYTCCIMTITLLLMLNLEDWNGWAMSYIIIIISVLPKGRSFTANSGTKSAMLPKGRSYIAISGT